MPTSHLPGRDAWAKHKDLDPYQARWLYVDALLKVCPYPYAHLFLLNVAIGVTEVLGQDRGEGL